MHAAEKDITPGAEKTAMGGFVAMPLARMESGVPA
jgi:hypothetical protein